MDEFINFSYWYLHEFSCKLVLRNRKWFNDNINAIKETWDIIEHERVHGYEHRAPQKRVKKENSNTKIQGCLINITGNINDALDNIDMVTNIIESTPKNDESNIEDTKSVDSDSTLNELKLNRFKVHTESFDETQVDIL